MRLYYDTRFDIGGPMGDHNAKVRETIYNKIGPNQALIDSTHIDVSPELCEFVKQHKNRQVLVYSGIDWENTTCRPHVHDFLKNEIKNLVYIGNSNTEFYFSFWLDFVRSNKQHYINTREPDIKKLYLSLNRKPHQFRVDLVKSLIDHNLLDEGFVSLGLENQQYSGVQFPLVLDREFDEENLEIHGNYAGIPNDILGESHGQLWKICFINVVTETTHHTDVFLSEKVFKPILGMRPFMVLGDCAVYDKLKSFGFDTFDDVFGTGYMQEDYVKRIQWISDTLTEFKAHNIRTIYNEFRPRLQHNFDVFDDAASKNNDLIYRNWSKI